MDPAANGSRSEAPPRRAREVVEKIEELMKHETAGDPVARLKWARRTTEKITDEEGPELRLCPHDTRTARSYTVSPR